MELKYVNINNLFELKEDDEELFLSIKFLIMSIFLVHLTKLGSNNIWNINWDENNLDYINSIDTEISINISSKFTVWNFLTPVIDTINIVLIKLKEKLKEEKINLKFKDYKIIPLEHIILDENWEIKDAINVQSKIKKAHILEQTLYGIFVNCCYDNIIITVSNLKMEKVKNEKKKKNDIDSFFSLYEEMETKFNTNYDLPVDFKKSNILYSLNNIEYNIKFDNGLLKTPLKYEKLKNGIWIMTNNHWSNIIATDIRSLKTIYETRTTDETIKIIEKSNSKKRWFCHEMSKHIIGMYFKKFGVKNKFEFIKKHDMLVHRLKSHIKFNYNNGISEICADLYEMKCIMWLYDFLENNKEDDDNNYFYTSSKHDFRGRIYYDSRFSVTDNKILRSIIYEKHDNEKRIQNFIDKKYIELFDENYTSFINIFDISLFKKWENKVDILNIILKVGSILRDKNIKEKYSDVELIKIGLNGYIKKIHSKDIHDSSQLFLCYNILDQIVKRLKNKKNYYIEKDAIGSVFQMMGLRCGVFKEMIHVLNFFGNDLICTYCYIKNRFLIEKNVKPEYQIYFSRKHIKNLMMTVGYGATKNAAIDRWLESINRKDLKRDSELVQLFLCLFDYIYEDGLKKIFKKDFKEVLLNEVQIDKNKNNELRSFVHYKKEKFCWLYTTNKTKRILPVLKKNEINLSKKRISMVVDEKNKIDIRKSKIALRANYAHFLDSLLMRSLIDEVPNVLSVHDCALFPYTKNSEVILALNKSYNKMYKHYNKDMDFKIENVLIWS